MAMHSAALLADKNRQLRSGNLQQKQKKEQRCEYMSDGGTLSVAEGTARIKRRREEEEERVKRRREEEEEQVKRRRVKEEERAERRREEEERVKRRIEEEQELSAPRQRAPPRCSKCRSFEHTARTCNG
ncbi:hypothetical protein B0J13DRAFT_318495 [Dactylonectria estremocensis]|uniref:Uncharacterized protein n=1 Tax=Dactylonectria estremocensis TaxID=1079267 RepID=A0A9P9EYI0_9HYPO|nr:hypothetical protein B0J13DRAFT_318495 [Dactylonectria estremocensis]